MNKQFLFENNAKIAVGPVDLAAAQTGARIKMDALERLVILVQVAAGAAATITPQLKQHSAAVGGTSKALDITNSYYHKVGAAQVFTKVEPTVAYNEVVAGALIAGNSALLAIEVLPEDLDVNNNFSHVSVDFPAAGGARIASAIYIAKKAEIEPAHEVAI